MVISSRLLIIVSADGGKVIGRRRISAQQVAEPQVMTRQAERKLDKLGFRPPHFGTIFRLCNSSVAKTK
jgi:hypothetical protein